MVGVVCNGRNFGRATAFGAETNRTGCLAVTVICAVIASSTKERADTNTDTSLRAFENLCYSTTVVLLYVYIRVAVKTARSRGLLRTALYIHFHPRRTNCALEFLTADS